MKLEGSLDTFPLRELIEMVAYSSVTGALNIFGPGEPGHLYFRDGVLYHIVRGPTQDIDALAEMLEMGSATFTFVSEAEVEQETLWGSLTYHLQCAERIAARWRQLRTYVPNLDLVPLLVSSRESALRRVGQGHQQVLDTIDGQASLRQIAATMGWAELDVAEAIVQMTVDGLVELRSQRVTASPTITKAPPRADNGVFDRILGRAPLPQRCGAESEPARTAEPHTPEDLIIKLLRG